ncbi:hypothetical protein RIF29_16138 [Crotalaria pallida]|uniref:Root meristem growth factor 8 n=1 Tax=Crotalaria pallida TaxID=3830 RepID=A0AAN9ID93_CROPI
MGLIIIITLLSISFSALLPPCTSLNLQLQPSLHHQGPGAINAQQKLSLPVLPRKLRFTEKVQEYDEVRYQLASHKQKNTLPAGKQNMVVGSKGTKEEWSEGGDDPSKYFTMDYPKVNRRRPIHNKNLPVGP